MGDLATDTTVEQAGPSTFTCDLSPDWEIWGPNGGYLAAVAMRAAGVASGRARPASINAHFVGAGRSEPVDISVEVTRETKVATSVTARISQEGRPLLVATVWGVDGNLDGLEHHTTLGPHDVPDPEDLQSTKQLLGVEDGRPRHPFWGNIEQRPTEWIDDWDTREASEPSTRAWVKFVPTATFADRWVDACRSLILIDLDSWPSARSGHATVNSSRSEAAPCSVVRPPAAPTSEPAPTATRAVDLPSLAWLSRATTSITTRSTH